MAPNRTVESSSAQALAPDLARGDWKASFNASIRSRDMTRAAAIFATFGHTIDPQTWAPDTGDAEFIDHCARLLDRKVEYLSFVEALLKRYHEVHEVRSIPMPDWTHLQLAHGIVLFQHHDLPQAIARLTFTEHLAKQSGDDDLAAMTQYYLARAHYKTGQAGKALELITEADRWLGTRRPTAGALCKMVEAWVAFNTLSVESAQQALRAAEDVLWGRGDYVEDANIVAMKGRIARQRGDFKSAFACAREGVRLFEENGAGDHPNCARCYVHMAYARMLQAQAEGLLATDDGRRAMQEEVLDLLRTAEKICQRPEHARVLDRVFYFRACWSLLIGNEDAARRHAKKAYETAESVHDHVVMAHALIVLCQCARNQHDCPEARRLVHEARIMADKTDNRRVKARVAIWSAFIESDPPACNIKAAETLMADASALLRESDRDYLRWEFDRLAAHVAQIKARERNDQLDLPATLDDVLMDEEKPLEAALTKVARTIVRATHRRVGSIQRTADLLVISRNRVKRLCPELKR